MTTRLGGQRAELETLVDDRYLFASFQPSFYSLHLTGRAAWNIVVESLRLRLGRKLF